MPDSRSDVRAHPDDQDEVDIERVRPKRTMYRREQAEALYDLQMRDAIMRYTRDGIEEKEIAKKLGQSVRVIRRYKQESLDQARMRARYYELIGPHLLERARTPALGSPGRPGANRPNVGPRPSWRGEGPGPHIMNDPQAFRRSKRQRAYWPAEGGGDTVPLAPRALPLPAPRGEDEDRRPEGASSSSPPEYTSDELFERPSPPPPPPPPPPKPPTVSGELLESPDTVRLRAECLRLRKAMMSFSIMAEALGISEGEARAHTAAAINAIQESEAFNSDMERQLMLEQIDQMIAAIHAPATGYDILGNRVSVVFDAIDRMLKLMKQKSDLLGLGAPPAIDIRIKLQSLADEGGYDIVDVEEIARDVLQAHRLRLPEFR